MMTCVQLRLEHLVNGFMNWPVRATLKRRSQPKPSLVNCAVRQTITRALYVPHARATLAIVRRLFMTDAMLRPFDDEHHRQGQPVCHSRQRATGHSTMAGSVPSIRRAPLLSVCTRPVKYQGKSTGVTASDVSADAAKFHLSAS